MEPACSRIPQGFPRGLDYTLGLHWGCGVPSDRLPFLSFAFLFLYSIANSKLFDTVGAVKYLQPIFFANDSAVVERFP